MAAHSPALLSQNTLNQRESRKRRRMYMQDLERRVRTYETQGVHATAEVQTAARKVAEENTALKAEVSLLKQRCAELERGIAGWEAEPVPTNTVALQKRNIATRPLKQRKVIERPTSGTMPTHTVANSRGNEEELSCSPSLAFSTVSAGDCLDARDRRSIDLPSPSPAAAIVALESATHNDPAFVNTSPVTVPSTQIVASTCRPGIMNSTPCFEAALIIAGMRGVASHDIAQDNEILSELGCIESGSCGRVLSSAGCDRNDNINHDCGKADVCAINVEACVVDNGRLFGILAQET